MKMPPGSHEVSRRQLKMHFKTAIIAYMELSSFDHRLQPLTPTFLFFMGHIIEKCRNHPNPAVYHVRLFKKVNTKRRILILTDGIPLHWVHNSWCEHSTVSITDSMLQIPILRTALLSKLLLFLFPFRFIKFLKFWNLKFLLCGLIFW